VEQAMNKGLFAIFAVCLMFVTDVSYAEDWNLVKNVRRLEQVAPEYKEDKALDKKFLEVLDLTEKTKKDNELYAEAKRIVTLPTLNQSKYMDSFLYYMFIKSVSISKTGTAEPNYWLGLIKGYEKSPYMLSAGLVHMNLMPKNSPDIRADAQFLVNWLKAQKPEARVLAPEYARNMFMTIKARDNFAEGDFPKGYKVSYFMSSVTPIDGFLEDQTYVSLLAQIKEGREDVMTEMSNIYRKMGKRVEASDVLYQLAKLKVNAKDFQNAKPLLEDAVKLNPKNADAVKERDRIKLELTYQSLTPAAVPTPEAKLEEAAAVPAQESSAK
jgi:hypothetical protein